MKDNLEKSEKASRRIFRRYFPLIFILWILFVLYPNPLNLAISIQRVLNFDADPGAVAPILMDFPSDKADIERVVLVKIPYHCDWEVYGMPWYCPTVEQVLERGEGDCKARALVLASVLEAKNITYEVRSSPMHIWVDYVNKQETSIENTEVEFYEYHPGTGDRQFRIPDIGLGKLMDTWAAILEPNARRQKGAANLVLARFGSCRGDFAQEEDCAVVWQLRCCIRQDI